MRVMRANAKARRADNLARQTTIFDVLAANTGATVGAGGAVHADRDGVPLRRRLLDLFAAEHVSLIERVAERRREVEGLHARYEQLDLLAWRAPPRSPGSLRPSRPPSRPSSRPPSRPLHGRGLPLQGLPRPTSLLRLPGVVAEDQAPRARPGAGGPDPDRPCEGCALRSGCKTLCGLMVAMLPPEDVDDRRAVSSAVLSRPDRQDGGVDEGFIRLPAAWDDDPNNRYSRDGTEGLWDAFVLRFGGDGGGRLRAAIASPLVLTPKQRSVVEQMLNGLERTEIRAVRCTSRQSVHKVVHAALAALQSHLTLSVAWDELRDALTPTTGTMGTTGAVLAAARALLDTPEARERLTLRHRESAAAFLTDPSRARVRGMPQLARDEKVQAIQVLASIARGDADD